MPEADVFSTGWGKVAWVWEQTDTVIYPDGSRGSFEDVVLVPQPNGEWRDADGVLYKLVEDPRAGGHLEFSPAVDDLVNTVTGERHRWPPEDECFVRFVVEGPMTPRGPKMVLVECEGETIDPLCGRSYRAPATAEGIGTIIPRGP